MKLNKTLAVALHRAMWTDMKTELGDNPPGYEREVFKKEWIKKYFPNERVLHNCFLCEYAFSSLPNCTACPIRWPERDCYRRNFSYDKAPISDILALPEKDLEPTGNGPKYIFDEMEAVRAYYTYREDLLSKASGVPGYLSIKDHVKAIQEKAVEEYLEKHTVTGSVDIDRAFKQYADEQKAPIFCALAEASGLSVYNESVKAHIYEIKRRAKQDGRAEERERIVNKIGEMLNDKSTGETKNS